MTATETKVFKPNSVFIPASAVPDNTVSHSCIDPKDCTLLYNDGGRDHGYLYTKEAWENDGAPSYRLFHDHYYVVTRCGKDDYMAQEPICRAGLSISDQEPVEGDRIQLLPEMCCVKEDETNLYGEDWIKQHNIKRIFGVYVFNKRRVVYACETTPSYERTFMGSQFELTIPDDADNYEEKREDASEEVGSADAGCELFSYMHCSDVDRAMTHAIKEHGGWLPPEGVLHGGYAFTGLASVTEEDAIEEIRELAATCGDL
jgi:hypothetical protein